jgi:hypothetical protein
MMNSDKLRRMVVRVVGLAIIAGGLAMRPAAAAQVVVFCTPNEVQVYPERLHVRCDESFGGIVYFVTSTADAAQAARSLSVIQTAMVAGRTLIVRYDPDDLSGAAIGCLTQDCRLIISIGFRT